MASTEINVKLSIVTKAFEDSVQRMMAQLGLMARRFREAGWMPPYWVGNRKCKRGEASVCCGTSCRAHGDSAGPSTSGTRRRQNFVGS